MAIEESFLPLIPVFCGGFVFLVFLVEGACMFVYVCVVDCGVLYQEKTEWEDRFTREDVLCCTRKLLIWVYSLQVRVLGKPYSQENV